MTHSVESESNGLSLPPVSGSRPPISSWDQAKRLMKITDFFLPSQSFTNKEEERPPCTPAINNTEQQEKIMSLSGSITLQTPKKRKERFTDPELHKLVDTILAHIKQLFGPNPLNASGKAGVWDKVVKEVNKAGGKKRTKEECKKRWLDYKRKVKQTIEGLQKQGGQMPPLSDILTKRQKMVAEFFKMDASDSQKRKIHDESSSDIECVSSNEHLLTPSYNIGSEDEFLPSQNESFPSSSCTPSTSHQDKLISQSSKVPQAASEPCDPPNTKAVHLSIPPHTATQPQLQKETELHQLVAQQKNIFEVLQSIQENVTASLNIQNKMYNLVKGSFLELHKTLFSSQKASSERSSILELRLNSINTKLEEMNSVLQVKQLQEIMSSDESELCASGTQDVRSTPAATYTPATTNTPKNNAPARKRALNQTPSPLNLIKKTKQI